MRNLKVTLLTRGHVQSHVRTLRNPELKLSKAHTECVWVTQGVSSLIQFVLKVKRKAFKTHLQAVLRRGYEGHLESRKYNWVLLGKFSRAKPSWMVPPVPASQSPSTLDKITGPLWSGPSLPFQQIFRFQKKRNQITSEVQNKAHILTVWALWLIIPHSFEDGYHFKGIHSREGFVESTYFHLSPSTDQFLNTFPQHAPQHTCVPPPITHCLSGAWSL